MKTLKEIRVERIIDTLVQGMRIESCAMAQVMDAATEGSMQPNKATKTFRRAAEKYLHLRKRYLSIAKVYSTEAATYSNVMEYMADDYLKGVEFFSWPK